MEYFHKAFHRILNPLQVKMSVYRVRFKYVELKLFVDLSNLFFLFAEGDGTIFSVVNYLKIMPKWKDQDPSAVILPLETGDDFSRVLGWGESIEKINATYIIKEYYCNINSYDYL